MKTVAEVVAHCRKAASNAERACKNASLAPAVVMTLVEEIDRLRRSASYWRGRSTMKRGVASRTHYGAAWAKPWCGARTSKVTKNTASVNCFRCKRLMRLRRHQTKKMAPIPLSPF